MCSLKLYDDDRVKVSFYKRPPKPQFRQYSDTHKIHLATGELLPYTLQDTYKRAYSDFVSLTRTRRTIESLSKLNRFRYFLTITFNKQFINRSDAAEVRKKFRAIIKRLIHAYGGVSYIQVGEFHEDLSNIHYHIMINFVVAPKLKYVGLSRKGQRLYHFDKVAFKRDDCFLTVEKLTQSNNVHYLLKYLTKGYCFPFHRRFGCTRDLVRTRVVEHCSTHSIYAELIVNHFKNFYCFDTVCENDKCMSYIYTSRRWRASARQVEMDLSINNIKGDNVKDIFNCIKEKILYWNEKERIRFEDLEKI
jgi:hypothetical protein